jgi:hypothetical protein
MEECNYGTPKKREKKKLKQRTKADPMKVTNLCNKSLLLIAMLQPFQGTLMFSWP